MGALPAVGCPADGGKRVNCRAGVSAGAPHSVGDVAQGNLALCHREPAPVADLQNRSKQLIEVKLNHILLNEVIYDGLPLAEVVRDLNDQARRRDPDKQGINFLISKVVDGSGVTGIDPTTGQPLPSTPTVVDVSNATIHLQLRNVRMKDVIEAIVKITEVPLKYSVEDYGVVISPASGPFPSYGASSRFGEPLRLQVRTFKVNTNTFVAGLQSAFGISVTTGEKAGSPREIQVALRRLLEQLGVKMDVAGKAVFYNDLTGIVMVRATTEDLELVQAAIETLGGNHLNPRVAAIGGDPGSAEASGAAEELGARYGPRQR
jgi:hypothetical protein